MLQQHQPQRCNRPSVRSILSGIGFDFQDNNYKLGSGRYSKVYKAFYRDAGRHFAIKIIDLENVSSEFKRKFLPREITIWRQLDHHNIVFLYKDFKNSGYQFSVMELASGGDLLTYVQKNGPIAEVHCREWMLQLIEAISYLHRQLIAHRDLKLENVLLGDGGIIKIADYGFSKHSDELSATFCGSKSYSAPEILRGIVYDMFKADIWSLGVMGFILLTNTMPFREDVDNNQIVDMQRKKNYRYSSRLNLSNQCCATIDTMMTFEPTMRPTIFDCASLSWFVRFTSSANHSAAGHKRSSATVVPITRG